MLEARSFIDSFAFLLPPLANWSPAEMQSQQHKVKNIVSARLGWDITDYGQEKFDELGMVLFTMRNGTQADLESGSGMCYAEKIMISRESQLSPMHRHITKAEDIINRGGGVLALELFNSDSDGDIDTRSDVTVATDGVLRTQGAGEILRLNPGASVTLMPGNWHAFWGEQGDVLIGEVSTVNNDLTDNIFRDPLGRFSEIDEDVEPLHLLVSDYDKWLTDSTANR